MIDVFPFNGFPVAVLGLGPGGLAAARALHLSGAEVSAWDDAADNRAEAAALEIPILDLSNIADWREIVSLVVEPEIAHGKVDAHPLVAAARAAGTEVISDAELLARAQRDARYVAVVSRDNGPAMLDLMEHVLGVTGNEAEVGGDDERAILGLHPLELGGTYVLDMPPGRADSTVSITFDAALFLGIGRGSWGGYGTSDEIREAVDWVFHRQTGQRGAIVNVDEAAGRAVFEMLQARRNQVVIPVSGISRVPGGVYMGGTVLYDDIAGRADAVIDLALPDGGNRRRDGLLAAAAYGTAMILDIPPHAAMASIRSFHEE